MKIMLMRQVLTLLMLITSQAVVAQDSLQATQSNIVFEIKNLGITVDGTLDQLQVSGNFNADDWTRTQLSARIPVKTLASGIKMRDRHLMQKEYFHQKEHPFIFFTSEEITQEEPGRYLMRGMLTIKGTTREEAIRFEAVPTPSGFKLLGEMDLNRLDYEVGEESLTLSNELKVKISCILERVS